MGSVERKTYLEAAEEAYDPTPDEDIGDGFELFHDGNTLDVWVNNATRSVLLAERGTDNLGDVLTDATLPANGLSWTWRYRRDKQSVKKIMAAYPDYSYYATGHSLGGAVVLQLLRDFPSIRHAETFNSAVQPVDILRQNTRNVTNNYINRDPLYRLAGRKLRSKRVYAYKPIDVASKAPLFIKAHRLNQFRVRGDFT